MLSVYVSGATELRITTPPPPPELAPSEFAFGGLPGAPDASIVPVPVIDAHIRVTLAPPFTAAPPEFAPATLFAPVKSKPSSPRPVVATMRCTLVENCAPFVPLPPLAAPSDPAFAPTAEVPVSEIPTKLATPFVPADVPPPEPPEEPPASPPAFASAFVAPFAAISPLMVQAPVAWTISAEEAVTTAPLDTLKVV